MCPVGFNTCIHSVIADDRSSAGLTVWLAFILDVCFSVLGGGLFVGTLLSSLFLTFWEELCGLVQICRRKEGTWDSGSLPLHCQHYRVWGMPVLASCSCLVLSDAQSGLLQSFLSPPVFQGLTGFQSWTQSLKPGTGLSRSCFLNQLISLACIGKSLS